MTNGDEGIWYRDWNPTALPWRHFERTHVTTVRLLSLFRVDLVDADVFFSGLGDKVYGLLAGNALIGANYLLVPNRAL